MKLFARVCALALLVCGVVGAVAAPSATAAAGRTLLERDRVLPRVAALHDGIDETFDVDHPLHGWRAHGRACSKTARIELIFAVVQQNEHRLESVLRQVSDPASPTYRQHWSTAKLDAFVRPTVTATNAVMHFIREHTAADSRVVVTSSPSGAFVTVSELTVAAAERMLHTQFRTFTHVHSGHSYIRAPHRYHSLPAHVARHVDFVGGVHRLPSSTLSTFTPAALASPAFNSTALYDVTPAFLKKLYAMPADIRGGNVKGNSQAVIEFLGQYYSDSDLQTYLRDNKLPPQQISLVNGTNDLNNPGGEAQLDVEVIMGVAPGVPTEFWSYDGLRNNSAPASNENQEPFLRYIAGMERIAHPPLVHSVSYDDDENSLTKAYATRCNKEFQKAGIRGLTLLFAAGDDGVGGITVRNQGAKACTKTLASFPSSSPWVTSVGGTQLNAAMTGEITSSTATGSRITTGGGFSYFFETPWYQQEEVTVYLAKAGQGLPPTGKFNNKGRGYPDISGMATNYLIDLKGLKTHIGGTSASTPLLAAMVSLLNEVAMERDAAEHHATSPPVPASSASSLDPSPTPKKTKGLGFINPFLYKLARDERKLAFKDIVYGNNACSANPNMCCPWGFPAAEGWDAVTGVGVPNFYQMALAVGRG